ncbi:MAG: ribosome-associated translation inhibitor RaiA [Oscillospiraceae bacterium]|nr:ribosome-associated translation inhibitor RaiA [Oscillospiraceae bacterium]
MNITTNGRKVNLKQHFLDKVEKRMSKFDKYFEDDAKANVTVTVESNRQTVEITVKDRNFIYRAERTGQNMETAFSEAADVIDRQIVKHKKKLGDRIKKAAPETAGEPMPEPEYAVAREKRFTLKPMDTEEAILQMDLLGHSFYVFKLTDTGETAVVYKRKDGGYGLIVPEG